MFVHFLFHRKQLKYDVICKYLFFFREKCTCNWTKQRQKKTWANKGQNTSAAEMKNIRSKILKMPKQGKNLSYSACQQQPSHLSDSCIGKL